MIITIIIIINSHNDKLLTKQLSVGSLPEWKQAEWKHNNIIIDISFSLQYK